MATLWTCALLAQAPPFITAPGLNAAPGVRPGLLLHPLEFAWSPDGRLWTAEYDPRSQSCRVVVLLDPNQDGLYDRLQVFLEDLPWVSGLQPWGDGALLLTAPDLVFAADTDGDGRANTARRLWIGFSAAGLTHRANSLRPALDGWIHAANGLGTGRIQLFEPLEGPPPSPTPEPVDFTGTDFQFLPREAKLEPAAGLSWSGRARDDFGHWFGRQPELPACLYPMPAHYAARNATVEYPDPVVPLVLPADLAAAATDIGLSPPRAAPGSLPAGFEVLRNALPNSPPTTTILFGDADSRCVWQVHLAPGAAWHRPRPTSITLILRAHADSAFLPSAIRTGPDGAIWIADAALAEESPTSPPGIGLWRIAAPRTPPKPCPNLTQLPPSALVPLLRSPAGALRDLVQQELDRRPSPALQPLLAELARDPAALPAARVEALHALARRGETPTNLVLHLWADPDPQIRRHAVQLAEPFLRRAPNLPEGLQALVEDPDPEVRFQLALSLGESRAAAADPVLAELAARDADDAWLQAAVVSAAAPRAVALLRAVLDTPTNNPRRTGNLARRLVDTALTPNAHQHVLDLARILAGARSVRNQSVVLSAIDRLLDRSQSVLRLDATVLNAVTSILEPHLREARSLATRNDLAPEDRLTAVVLLGWQVQSRNADLDTLLALALNSGETLIREAALGALLRHDDPGTGRRLLTHWMQLRPSLRSQALAPFVQRPTWVPRLLEALDQGVVAATELTTANRQRLLDHPDPALRNRAAHVLEATLPPPRTTVLERFAPSLALPGDARRGRLLFDRNCASCHRLNSEGPTPGPDLVAIGVRSPLELMTAILDPNRAIEPRFRAWEIETREGDVLTGILGPETPATLTILQSGPKHLSVNLAAVLTMRVSNFSLMPEGLEYGLTPQDLADLLALLVQARHGPTGNPSSGLPIPNDTQSQNADSVRQ